MELRPPADGGRPSCVSGLIRRIRGRAIPAAQPRSSPPDHDHPADLPTCTKATKKRGTGLTLSTASIRPRFRPGRSGSRRRGLWRPPRQLDEWHLGGECGHGPRATASHGGCRNCGRLSRRLRRCRVGPISDNPCVVQRRQALLRHGCEEPWVRLHVADRPRAALASSTRYPGTACGSRVRRKATCVTARSVPSRRRYSRSRPANVRGALAASRVHRAAPFLPNL